MVEFKVLFRGRFPYLGGLSGLFLAGVHMSTKFSESPFRRCATCWGSVQVKPNFIRLNFGHFARMIASFPS